MHTEDAAFEDNLLQYCTVSVRSTLQNFAKHNWMKIFTLTSSVFAKVSLRSAIAGTRQNECKIGSFRSVSAPKCGKIALFATASRDQWKFLLRTVKRRHCPSNFFTRVAISTTVYEFWLAVVDNMFSKLVHSWSVVSQILITWHGVIARGKNMPRLVNKQSNSD